MKEYPYYPVLRESIDFVHFPGEIPAGTRAKKTVQCTDGRKAIFKYDGNKKYRLGEECSEKIASELAKLLDHEVADIDLAEGAGGGRGLLSYLFINIDDGEEQFDAEADLGIDKLNEEKYYTIYNIEHWLAEFFPEVDFEDLLKIFFFDAWVGERDRHCGNWGTTLKNGHRAISPMYDTANCLLTHFQNPKTLKANTTTIEQFEKYLHKNKLAIRTDDTKEPYSPTISLIDYLLKNYYDFTIKEIRKLATISENEIEDIVYKIPPERMTNEHKKWIVKMLTMQQTKIIQKGGIR